MRTTGSLLVLALIVMPAAVLAAAPAADGIETLIVTATRRAQSLADTPAAVSVYSHDTLEQSGTTDLRGLNQVVPSLMVSTGAMEQTSSARIRGVGTVGENVGLESSVGTFVDGVYRARTAIAVTELGDISQIEVLRGPQGTLFGRNTSAGLINIVTAEPSFTFGGTASAGYGNFNGVRLTGGVTGPLASNVAASWSGVYQRRDGFLTDTLSGRDVNDRDRYLLRGQILFTPSDAGEIRLIADYANRHEVCCAFSYLPPRDLARDASGNVVFAANSLLPILQSLGGTITGGAPEDRSTAITPGRDFHNRVKDYGVSGEVDWQLGTTKLAAISAYRIYDGLNHQDVDFNAADIIYRDRFQQRFETFTQEVRIQDTAFDGRLDWLAGGYFANEQLHYFDGLRYGKDAAKFLNCLVVAGTAALRPTLSLASPTCSLAPASAFPGYDGLAALLGVSPLNGTGRSDTFHQRSRNYAAFTHNIIHIDDATSATLGLRYTNENKRMDADLVASNTLCTAAATNASASIRALAAGPCSAVNALVSGAYAGSKGESQWTGTAVLSRRFDLGLLAYVSYARGYKAGGFNLDRGGLVPGSATVDQLTFAPETVNSFEAGVKGGDQRLRWSAAAFYALFANFQLNTFNGVNFVVENIQGCNEFLAGADQDLNAATGTCAAGHTRGGVVSQGLELEGQAALMQDVSLTAGFTYADTHFRHDLAGSGGRALTPVLFQLPGRALSNAPRYVATGGVTYTPPLGTGLVGLLHGDIRYQSPMIVGSDLDLEKRAGSLVFLDARLGVAQESQKWSVELWVRNLLDESAMQLVADAPLQGSGTLRAVQRGLATTANQLYAGIPIEPRTFGATLRVRF